jgi:hypothetical protein
MFLFRIGAVPVSTARLGGDGEVAIGGGDLTQPVGKSAVPLFGVATWDLGIWFTIGRPIYRNRVESLHSCWISTTA